MSQHIVNVLLLYIMRHSNLKTSIPSVNKTKYVNRECAFVKQYIDQHYADNISLDQLANRAFVNKFHLIHVFTKQFGVSPINYLIERRLEESKFLLKNTHMSVTDVSKGRGFFLPAFSRNGSRLRSAVRRSLSGKIRRNKNSPAEFCGVLFIYIVCNKGIHTPTFVYFYRDIFRNIRTAEILGFSRALRERRYAFSPLIAIPCTKYFCAKKYMSTHGSMASMLAARTVGSSIVLPLENICSATCKVYIFSSVQ